jgi:hypothetical protein
MTKMPETPEFYVLLDWIDDSKLDWFGLSSNPNAIYLLEKNPSKINWKELSPNPNAIRLLEKNQEKIDWKQLSGNPNAIHLLEQNQDKTDWRELYWNPNARHLVTLKQEEINRIKSNIEVCPETIKWDMMSLFQDQNAINLLEKNPEKIDWHGLCLCLKKIHYHYWKSIRKK